MADKQACGSILYRKHDPDLVCEDARGHGKVHHCGKFRWGDPERPRGNRNDPPSNGQRIRTKAGSYWSKAAVTSGSTPGTAAKLPAWPRILISRVWTYEHGKRKAG